MSAVVSTIVLHLNKSLCCSLDRKKTRIIIFINILINVIRNKCDFKSRNSADLASETCSVKVCGSFDIFSREIACVLHLQVLYFYFSFRM